MTRTVQEIYSEQLLMPFCCGLPASTDHRGTPDYPGRTVTLEPEEGAHVAGCAYRVSGYDAEQLVLSVSSWLLPLMRNVIWIAQLTKLNTIVMRSWWFSSFCTVFGATRVWVRLAYICWLLHRKFYIWIVSCGQTSVIIQKNWDLRHYSSLFLLHYIKFDALDNGYYIILQEESPEEPVITGVLVYIGSPNRSKNRYYLGPAPLQNMARWGVCFYLVYAFLFELWHCSIFTRRG